MSDNYEDLAGDSEFDLNFTGVGEWGGGFDPLPVGTYTVVVAEAKPGRSKNNNPKVTLTLTLNPVEHPEYANRKVWDDLTLTPGAMPRVKQALSCIFNENMDGKQLANGWWNDLIGLTCRVMLDQETYTNPQTGNTKINNKVKNYLPAEAGPSNVSAPSAGSTQTSGGFSI